ncbi:PP0621 family protein [Helicobacter sp. 12S02232-10]|uniref:PP0621 family protein n=1 Tax=Helicobacter sp. 12S02232-10 TaxID=1476197 RepID=UPI0021518A9B|nr:PP0621 family protein [Helicobacter sp. 12S02232-10]
MRFLIPLILIGVVIWYFFFRKTSRKSKNSQDDELMVECCECGTYVSSKEAILSNGKYFCSRKCLNQKEKK